MTVFETIRARLAENIVAGFARNTEPVRPEAAKRYLAELRDDGSWADVNYAGRDKSAWAPSRHLSRLLMMLRAARSGEEDESELVTGARLGLKCWLELKPQSDNWWHNDIGTPTATGYILTLLDGDIDSEDRADALTILERVEIAKTGQNRAWLATINFMRGVLTDDEALVQVALDAIFDGVQQADAPEGIQPDWSFHQHGPQLYQGNYGTHFLETNAPYAVLLKDTPFAMPMEKLQVLSNLMLNGTQWMTWGSLLDYHVVGRFISSPSRSRWESRGLVPPCRYLADGLPEDAGQLLAYQDRLIEKTGPGSEGAPVGNRHYWRSDFMVHRRPSHYASIRMSSTRTVRSEACNREGLLNYHLGDGVTLFLQRGDEYIDIFPVWDWRRLPGATTRLRESALPELSTGRDTGATELVGGVSDGENGAAAMLYDLDNVSAKKAYFCHDDTMVCLGAEVTAFSADRIVTSVNQCLLKGDVVVGEGRESWTFDETRRMYGALDWVHHDQTGYLILQQMAVEVGRQAVWGGWNRVNGNESADRVMKDVFSLTVNHGMGPEGGHYAYAVKLGLDAEATAAASAHPDFEVLMNRHNVQAVRFEDARVTQIVFWQAGRAGQGAWGVFVDKPCILMAKESPGRMTLSVSEPTQKLERLTVTLNGVWKGEGCERVEGRTKIVVELPSEGDAGSTVVMELARG